MGHRYYDTRIGRFITQDPKGAGGNWYAYANNNPVKRIDALGLDAPLSDFGLRPGDMYNVEGISAARAGMNTQLNQSSGLIAKFRYFEVDRVFYQGTGADRVEVGRIELFEYAVPVGTNIMGNYFAAAQYANSHHASPLVNLLGSLGPVLAMRDKIGDAKYVNKYFKNGTVGDFKDKNFLGIGRPGAGTRLWELADNGGNMNGGMGMQGLGMSPGEIAISGDAHRSMMSHGYLPDDAMGAAVLQVGYGYASQLP